MECSFSNSFSGNQDLLTGNFSGTGSTTGTCTFSYADPITIDGLLPLMITVGISGAMIAGLLSALFVAKLWK